MQYTYATGKHGADKGEQHLFAGNQKTLPCIRIKDLNVDWKTNNVSVRLFLLFFQCCLS